jgi:hypothetical protein
MTRVARGDATIKYVLAVLAASAVVFVCGSKAAEASRTASPASVDFGTIKNGPAGGRASATVLYAITADEPIRYAYTRASGGAANGTTQFSIGGGDCYSVFPPLPLMAASCSTVIQFDYSRAAAGLSTGTLVIDGDTNFDTTADQLPVPLRANVVALHKRKCKKNRNRSAAGVKKCKRKKR